MSDIIVHEGKKYRKVERKHVRKGAALYGRQSIRDNQSE
jgi:hypothetical protein